MKKLCALLVLITLLTGCGGLRGSQKTCLSYHPKLHWAAKITSQLAYSNNLDPRKIYICIIDDTIVNAWVDKHPQIYLTTGFLNAVPNKNALMCVLAHELSHYTLNHIAKTNRISFGISAAFQVADLLLPGVGYLNHIVNPTVTRAYGRSNELDADENAVEMCQNAHMVNAAQNMIDMLTWLKSYDKEKDQFFLWATHPPLDERIKNLNEKDKRRG